MNDLLHNAISLMLRCSCVLNELPLGLHDPVMPSGGVPYNAMELDASRLYNIDNET